MTLTWRDYFLAQDSNFLEFYLQLLQANKVSPLKSLFFSMQGFTHFF